MLFIPRKYISYLLSILCLIGVFMAAKSSMPDKGVAIGVLTAGALSGVLVAYFDRRKNRRNQKPSTVSYGLSNDEMVVFTVYLTSLGTETDRLLGGSGSQLTLTNKRMIVDNGISVFTVYLNEIVSCSRVEKENSPSKKECILITLNTEIVYGDGKLRLSGFRFYFNKDDLPLFENSLKAVLPGVWN